MLEETKRYEGSVVLKVHSERTCCALQHDIAAEISRLPLTSKGRDEAASECWRYLMTNSLHSRRKIPQWWAPPSLSLLLLNDSICLGNLFSMQSFSLEIESCCIQTACCFSHFRTWTWNVFLSRETGRVHWAQLHFPCSPLVCSSWALKYSVFLQALDVVGCFFFFCEEEVRHRKSLWVSDFNQCRGKKTNWLFLLDELSLSRLAAFVSIVMWLRESDNWSVLSETLFLFLFSASLISSA